MPKHPQRGKYVPRTRSDMSPALAEVGSFLTEAGLPSNQKRIQVITPGWGSSGYYSPDVLKAACTAGIFAEGTHMHLDHPTRTAERDLPERSTKDIAAVLIEAGTWDEAGQRVVAVAELMPDYAEKVNALAPYIGVSITGSATDVTIGAAEGRTGRIIAGLAAVSTVDFVTRAGRGGKVLAESERDGAADDLYEAILDVEESAIEHGVDEATVGDIRQALAQQLSAAYGGERTWMWIADFDDTTVWFEVGVDGTEQLLGQTYTLDDSGDSPVVALTGEPFPVKRTTSFVPDTTTPSTTPPVAPVEEDTDVPAARSDETAKSKENAMGTITIEESEHARLTEKADRVEALVAENATLKAENTGFKEATVVAERKAAAAKIVAEAKKFDDLQTAGLLANLPLTEGGEFDEAAFKTTVTEAAKKLGESTGRVRGFGEPTEESTTVTEADLDAIDAAAFGQIKEA